MPLGGTGWICPVWIGFPSATTPSTTSSSPHTTTDGRTSRATLETASSFDLCLGDYRMSAMFCLVYPVIAGGNLDLAPERGVELVAAMLGRSLATILDLDCDEMIPT